MKLPTRNDNQILQEPNTVNTDFTYFRADTF